MKQKWLNYIAKQYRKHFKDPLDDLSMKLQDKKFKSKSELFNYITKNSIGGLKRILDNNLSKIKRKEDDKNERN